MGHKKEGERAMDLIEKEMGMIEGERIEIMKRDRERTWSEIQGFRRGKGASTYYVTPLGCVNTTVL